MACRTHDTPPSRAAAVRSALAGSLTSRDWLPEEFQQPDDHAYRAEVIHVDGRGDFSVMAMTWLPGQRTSIHDHIAWCVVGMYSGEEHSSGYSLHSDGLGDYLVPRCHQVWLPGDTDVLIPPAEDIHEVVCSGTAPAVSLHVYGADIRVARTSINRRFDHLPVRRKPDGAQVAWRDSRRTQAQRPAPGGGRTATPAR